MIMPKIKVNPGDIEVVIVAFIVTALTLLCLWGLMVSNHLANHPYICQRIELSDGRSMTGIYREAESGFLGGGTPAQLKVGEHWITVPAGATITDVDCN